MDEKDYEVLGLPPPLGYQSTINTIFESHNADKVALVSDVQHTLTASLEAVGTDKNSIIHYFKPHTTHPTPLPSSSLAPTTTTTTTPTTHYKDKYNHKHRRNKLPKTPIIKATKQLNHLTTYEKKAIHYHTRIQHSLHPTSNTTTITNDNNDNADEIPFYKRIKTYKDYKKFGLKQITNSMLSEILSQPLVDSNNNALPPATTTTASSSRGSVSKKWSSLPSGKGINALFTANNDLNR